MANNYQLNETLDYVSLSGPDTHKALDYVHNNYNSLNRKKAIEYIDINISPENWDNEGVGYYDITEDLASLNLYTTDIFTGTDFHILAFPPIIGEIEFQKESDENGTEETIKTIFKESQNYIIYNDYNIRCIGLYNWQQSAIRVYFKADSKLDSDISIRLLCIFTPENYDTWSQKEEEKENGNS